MEDNKSLVAGILTLFIAIWMAGGLFFIDSTAEKQPAVEKYQDTYNDDSQNSLESKKVEVSKKAVDETNPISGSLTINVVGDIQNLANPVGIMGVAKADEPISSVEIKQYGKWYKAHTEDGAWNKNEINYSAYFTLVSGSYTFEARMLDIDGKVIKTSSSGINPKVTLQFK